MPRTKVGQELEAISSVLDDNREILDLISQDLIGLRQADTGRLGLSAEQVLRCAILKQYLPD
jgi:IS5 family transposase